MNNLLEYANLIIAVVTTLTVITAIWTLRANHAWNRRKYALQLLHDWNENTIQHRRFIESSLPGLLDKNNKTKKIVELSKNDAYKIYSALPSSEEWELRFHIIQLFNYFELIATAYFTRVGDKTVIEDSFSLILTNYYDSLSNIIDIFQDNRNYIIWSHYSDAVHEWNKREVKFMKNTA